MRKYMVVWCGDDCGAKFFDDLSGAEKYRFDLEMFGCYAEIYVRNETRGKYELFYC